MNEFFENLKKSVIHLKAFNDFFLDQENYSLPEEQHQYDLYKQNITELTNVFTQINAFEQLYNQKDRQHILADVIEYILLGRAFYSMGKRRNTVEEKGKFVKGIMHFVNLLMCYESITANVGRRNLFLDYLSIQMPSIAREQNYTSLRNYLNEVGLPDSNEEKVIGQYFDKLLPKTAGGLWHELLVYIFLIRFNKGFILPLLLHQKIYSKMDHLVPPDFLIITESKQIFGIEVGIKKEIQSGSFSLKTSIPTATIDTINSRSSDRCPICKQWILLCPFVIDKFSNFAHEINKIEIKCLTDCDKFTTTQIVNGECCYSKYSRQRATRLVHTHHNFSNGYHYHYQCVLNAVNTIKKNEIILAQDNTAIKTHFPYYSGLDELK